MTPNMLERHPVDWPSYVRVSDLDKSKTTDRKNPQPITKPEEEEEGNDDDDEERTIDNNHYHKQAAPKMLPVAVAPVATRLAASLLFAFIFLSVLATANDSQVKCARTCVAQNCNSIGIRYGKYCGVGWSGCPGEKPCDDLDACCKIHDECVEKKGLIDIKCHEKFKRCIKKVKKSGRVGFSRDCPYDTAVPTMVQGMDMAIMLSQLGAPKIEL